MEKCGKVWRQESGAAAGHEMLAGVYSGTGGGRAKELRACSACAGDYEDPDRTVWGQDDAEDEERDGAPSATAEEFPAEE